MSSVHVDHLPRLDMEFGEKRCREAAASAIVRAAIAIDDNRLLLESIVSDTFGLPQCLSKWTISQKVDTKDTYP